MTQGQRKFADALRTVFLYGLDLLAPERCLFCDQLTDRELSLCEVCESALTSNDQFCPHCALPGCAGRLCPACLESPERLPEIVAPYVYDPMLAHLMQCWKYGKQRRLAKTAARLVLPVAETLASSDILLPTPLHWRRHLHRGFNQSEDLLEELLRLMDLPSPAPRVRVNLRRVQSQSPQTRATRSDRHRQVADLFATTGRLNGESITLIDDVCTTGATAAAMTRALKRAGAGKVTLLCLARTPAHTLATPFHPSASPRPANYQAT